MFIPICSFLLFYIEIPTNQSNYFILIATARIKFCKKRSVRFLNVVTWVHPRRAEAIITVGGSLHFWFFFVFFLIGTRRVPVIHGLSAGRCWVELFVLSADVTGRTNRVINDASCMQHSTITYKMDQHYVIDFFLYILAG